LLDLMKHCENDCYITISLVFKLLVLPLTKQLTNLSGNLWSRSLVAGRAERIEFLLVHKFYDGKYILPDKQREKESKKSKKKAAYAGGLVLEPKKGFYDKHVLLLDFNSLYPSIIQEYNICFTTVERKRGPDGDWEPSQIPEYSISLGVLPSVLKTLVERRRSVKTLIKTETDPIKLQQLDITQKALKLTANSMYGCLGFTQSRFYAKPLAELITRKGREILENTVNLVRSTMNLDVIYGDTDSIMIHTGLDDLEQVKEIGNKVKKEVNKSHHLLEIEIDGIFKTMLLLKKKKYAALKIEERNGVIFTQKESKGLDLVRRDWCDLSREMGNYVLDEILSGKSREDVINNVHSYLRQKGEEISNNNKTHSIPLAKFIITKALTKAPEEYPDAKNQPHVQVALKLMRAGKSVRAGDHIQYVICQGTGESFSERAYSPEEVLRTTDSSLTVDLQWYLSQQIHPPIARLCAHIEGTDTAQLADCLGLDPAKFRQKISAELHRDEPYFVSSVDEEDKFREVEHFSLVCTGCGQSVLFTKFMIPKCTYCPSSFEESYICNSLRLFWRKFVERYYCGYMVCNEESCKNRTRQLFFKKTPKCIVPGCKGTMLLEYTADDLYLQLSYLRSLFSKQSNFSAFTEMEYVISLNSRHFVSLAELNAVWISGNVC